MADETKRPFKPCPTHVTHEGKIEYCEQGPANHWGTCIGMKPEEQYRRELETWRDRKRDG